MLDSLKGQMKGKVLHVGGWVWGRQLDVIKQHVLTELTIDGGWKIWEQ
jgi:hypothetical protein